MAYVISVNLHRRHLNAAQRAMVVAHPLAFTYFQAEAAKRKEAGQKKGGPMGGRGRKKPCTSIDVQGLSTDEPKDRRHQANTMAGAAVNVGSATVDRARRVYDGCEELVKAVTDGEVSVTAAALLADAAPTGGDAQGNGETEAGPVSATVT